MITLHKVSLPEKHILMPMLEETLYSGYIAEGPKVLEFESKFGEFINNHYVASVNSCTSALLLSLMASGIGPGDEVITTPMTCLATNLPILLLGAKLVWADVNPISGNIDPCSIRSKITNKTKAILYVHWAGNPGYIEEINQIAKRYKLKVIEDAAHALGSKYSDGRFIGNHSDFVCFSFQAVKHLTTSDGGMIAVNTPNPEKDLEYIRRARWFGLPRKFDRTPTQWNVDIDIVGNKLHMNDITATIGLSQFVNNHVGHNIKLHIDNSRMYDALLSDIDDIILIPKNGEDIPSWVYTMLLVDSTQRDEFVNFMKTKGVEVGVVHVRNDQYSIFKDNKCHLPGVNFFSEHMINLPCGWWVSPSDVSYITGCVREFFKANHE